MICPNCGEGFFFGVCDFCGTWRERWNGRTAILDWDGEVITELEESMEEMKVKLTNGAPLPRYAKLGDAGMDLTSRNETFQISPGETVMVHTGVSVELPRGHYGAIVPRSGISSKRGLAPVNAPGTIDEGYRGEIMVPLHNYSEKCQIVEQGERVCQLIVAPYAFCYVEEVDELSETERGNGGFGSTGRGVGDEQ